VTKDRREALSGPLAAANPEIGPDGLLESFRTITVAELEPMRVRAIGTIVVTCEDLEALEKYFHVLGRNSREGAPLDAPRIDDGGVEVEKADIRIRFLAA